MKKGIKIAIVVALGVGLVVAGFYSWKSKQKLDYRDCLQETAFVANGQERKMCDLGFYILYQEREVEKQAQIYNPENTKDYWNLHVDGVFIQVQAKENIINMAIHDELYYQKAVENDITLNGEEEQRYRNTVMDFWMDLLDEQKENLPVSDEFVVEAMRRKAIAEKYQMQLAKKKGHSYASYQWDGAYYQKWLEKQKVEINHKIWDKIVVGDISLQHGKPNYVNGYNKKESE